jgi:hypothetical protein
MKELPNTTLKNAITHIRHFAKIFLNLKSSENNYKIP